MLVVEHRNFTDRSRYSGCYFTTFGVIARIALPIVGYRPGKHMFRFFELIKHRLAYSIIWMSDFDVDTRGFVCGLQTKVQVLDTRLVVDPSCFFVIFGWYYGHVLSKSSPKILF